MSKKESIFWIFAVILSFALIFAYIYFTSNFNNEADKKVKSITLYNKLLQDNNSVLSRVDFEDKNEKINTNTLYKSKNDYYFSGNAQNNWVKFANMFFRIIRIDENKNIRLLYSGRSINSTSAYIGEVSFNDQNDPFLNVSYLYGTSGSIESALKKDNSSLVKSLIDNWYRSNLLEDYDGYISKSSIYCNDKTSSDLSYPNSANYSHELSLSCSQEDSLSVENESLVYPASLITLDELIYAGASKTISSKPWYYYNADGESIMGNKTWLTLTPSKIEENVAFMWGVENKVNELNNTEESILKEVNSKSAYAIRPVISLKTCVEWESGDGSHDSPYQLKISETCKTSV